MKAVRGAVTLMAVAWVLVLSTDMAFGVHTPVTVWRVLGMWVSMVIVALLVRAASHKG